MSADSEKPNIIGGNWTVLHCGKICGLGLADLNVGRRPRARARVTCAVQPVRSIPVAIFLNHDAQSAAQMTRFWLRSKLPQQFYTYGAGHHNWPYFWSSANFFRFIVPSHVWHQWKALLVVHWMMALFWLYQVQKSNKPTQRADWLTV